jgi:hypothetical protein
VKSQRSRAEDAVENRLWVLDAELGTQLLADFGAFAAFERQPGGHHIGLVGRSAERGFYSGAR